MTAFYWQARERFDSALISYGFRIAAEYFNYESFGTGWAEYARRGMRVRLDWDGRDEALAVTCQRRALSRIPLGTWVNVEAMPGNARPLVRDRSRARIEAVRAATTAFVAGARTPAHGHGGASKDHDQPPNDR